MCQAVYQDGGVPSRLATGGNNLDADDDAVLDAGRSGLEFVPLDEVAASEEELPDIEAGDIADVAEDEDPALNTGDEEEPFLENEDEGEADVTGFVGGGKDEDA
jgi:hypothetical protein